MGDSDTPRVVSTSEKTFAVIADSETLREACFSPDGAAAAFITSKGNNYFVTNANGGKHEVDFAGNLVVSYNGKVTACQAHVGEHAVVLINDGYNKLYGWTGAPSISAEGSTAYWAMKAGNRGVNAGYVVVLGKNEVASYDTPGHLGFHPRTAKLIYSAQQEGASFLVRDGLVGPKFDHVLAHICHPKDDSIWYWAMRADKWYLMRDDVIVDRSDAILIDCGPVFDHGSGAAAYWKNQRTKWCLMLNGQKVQEVERPVEVVKSINVKSDVNYVYSAHIGEHVYMFTSHGREGPFDGVGAAVFSADGKRLAYLARRGPCQFLVLDGIMGAPSDAIWPEEGEYADYLEDIPVFREDGLSIAYRRRRGWKECVVHDDEEGALYGYICSRPAFSPCSGSLVHGAIDNLKEYIIIDGKWSDEFDRIWHLKGMNNLGLAWEPTFSGGKVVFGALRENTLCWKALPVGGGLAATAGR